MQSTQQMNIILPEEMAKMVRDRVAAGEYASESDVIREGLRSLMARDHDVESWLHDEVEPAYDALQADPASALSAQNLRTRLALEHATTIKQK